MKECLLCKRDMKTSKSLFGNGCIKSIYKLLNLDMPQKVKDMEHHLSKYIMKQVNITKLNTIQKQWLTDRYLTYQYIDNLKYGDYTELKEELKCDISNVGEIVEFSEFKTAEKIELKQAYTLFKKEEKFESYLYKINKAGEIAKGTLGLLIGALPVNLSIKKKTLPFEISALKSMQYTLLESIALGGRMVGYDISADFIEHSMEKKPAEIIITEGKVVEEIKKDVQFQSKIKYIMDKYGKDNSEFYANDKDDVRIQFDDGDLYYSLHGGSVFIKGKKNDDKWNLSIEFIDTYDYTKFKTMMDYYKDANSVPKSALSSILYNIAFFEMKFGLMREYKVIVKFEINDYEVR